MGPTNNPRYNHFFNLWDDGSLPECENCGKDMTGKNVHEGRLGWYCSLDCLQDSESGPETDYREDFHSDG